MTRQLTPEQKAAKNARAAARRAAAKSPKLDQAKVARDAEPTPSQANPVLCLTGDGDEVRVGDFVTFKDDIETSGKVVAYRRGFLEVSVYDSVTGDRTIYNIHPKHASKEN